VADRERSAIGRADEEWYRAHENFHAVLLAACPSSRLIDMSKALRAETELYRHWAVRAPGSLVRDVPAEHRGLRDAALARDADGGAQLLCEHLTRTTQILLGEEADLHGVRDLDRLSS
jgi:DNA-binding GntR family transcriptional regulator